MPHYFEEAFAAITEDARLNFVVSLLGIVIQILQPLLGHVVITNEIGCLRTVVH